MALPFLYVAPKDPDTWKAWAFNHAANHYDWIFAIQVQKHQTLPQYLLDPIDPDNIGMWVYNHQSAHNQVNAVLGTSGYDLLGLDWSDPDQFQEWLRLNGDEHVRVSAALGVN